MSSSAICGIILRGTRSGLNSKREGSADAPRRQSSRHRWSIALDIPLRYTTPIPNTKSLDNERVSYLVSFKGCS
eukprot:scaffold182798_cov14-Prasinocladus_malaysianus.AAC.2